jgi:hypothetical protein
MSIAKDMIPALQGVVPSLIATATADGIPNVTYVSQVFYIDEKHVALSFQYMNKTWKNICENPAVTLIVTHPLATTMWEMSLIFKEIKYDGTIFDDMDMQLAAIASICGMSERFKLKAILICEVADIKVLYNGNT